MEFYELELEYLLYLYKESFGLLREEMNKTIREAIMKKLDISTEDEFTLWYKLQ